MLNSIFFLCAAVFETTWRRSLEQTSLSKAQSDLQANSSAWCHQIYYILGSKSIPEEARLFALSIYRQNKMSTADPLKLASSPLLRGRRAVREPYRRAPAITIGDILSRPQTPILPPV